jgi:hypothetical protein
VLVITPLKEGDDHCRAERVAGRGPVDRDDGWGRGARDFDPALE